LEEVGMPGAATVPGVVEDERGDAAFCKDALNWKPLRNDLADAVADEKSCARRLVGGFDVEGVEDVSAAWDCVLCCAKGRAVGTRAGDPAEEAVSDLHKSAGDREGGCEGDLLSETHVDSTLLSRSTKDIK
jgi:hypothetical protein